MTQLGAHVPWLPKALMGLFGIGFWGLGCAGEAPRGAVAAGEQPQAAPEPAEGAPGAAAPHTHQNDTFQLSLEVPLAKVGELTNATVVLHGKAPYKCNDKYPYRFKPHASPGLSFPDGAPLGEGTLVSAEEVRLQVPFTPTQSGDHRLTGEVSFSVCTADRCLIERRELSAVVRVP